MESIVEFYGADKTNFSVVAGPGNFNDPDMVKFHQSASEITPRVDLLSRKYLVYNFQCVVSVITRVHEL